MKRIVHILLWFYLKNYALQQILSASKEKDIWQYSKSLLNIKLSKHHKGVKKYNANQILGESKTN